VHACVVVVVVVVVVYVRNSSDGLTAVFVVTKSRFH
jgi:hypothetical protein